MSKDSDSDPTHLRTRIELVIAAATSEWARTGSTSALKAAAKAQQRLLRLAFDAVNEIRWHDYHTATACRLLLAAAGQLKRFGIFDVFEDCARRRSSYCNDLYKTDVDGIVSLYRCALAGDKQGIETTLCDLAGKGIDAHRFRESFCVIHAGILGRWDATDGSQEWVIDPELVLDRPLVLYRNPDGHPVEGKSYTLDQIG